MHPYLSYCCRFSLIAVLFNTCHLDLTTKVPARQRYDQPLREVSTSVEHQSLTWSPAVHRTRNLNNPCVEPRMHVRGHMMHLTTNSPGLDVEREPNAVTTGFITQE
jgi:hypothetical protein